MPDAGVPHDFRDRSLDLPPRLAPSCRRPSPSRTSPSAINSSSFSDPCRPRLSRWDRILWVWLSRVWTGWRASLVIVQPATVLAWHRQGFQLYWRWKSRANPVGRPRLDAELRHLIRRMARENPTWGRRRIQAELALLGYAVAELTVAKYMHRTSPRPSPNVAGLSRPRMPERSSPSTSSSSPPSPSACSTSSSSSAMTAANSSTSTSRITPRRSGRLSRSSRRSRTIRLRDSCSAIETRSTARSSRGESGGWAFERSSPPHRHPGRTRSSSG